MLKNLVDATEKWRERAGENEAMMQVMTLGPDGKVGNFLSNVIRLRYRCL